MKQTTFESLAWSRKGKVTRRERLLAEVDAVIPWPQLTPPSLRGPLRRRTPTVRGTHWPGALSVYQKLINRARARCEHAFQVVNHAWGFSKVRYRGLEKNTARLFIAFALSNLYLLQRRLLPSQARCLS
jgi:hypothetical protein